LHQARDVRELPGGQARVRGAAGAGIINPWSSCVEDPATGFDYRTTAAGLAEVLREALEVAPGLADATVAETRIGFRPMSPDQRPLLGPVPGTDGLVVATGLGASGLTMGPHAGAIAARVALGLPPGADLSPFDPLR
jgi:glycine/D-amino acid oxidase-like deaminating enzyme